MSTPPPTICDDVDVFDPDPAAVGLVKAWREPGPTTGQAWTVGGQRAEHERDAWRDVKGRTFDVSVAISVNQDSVAVGLLPGALCGSPLLHGSALVCADPLATLFVMIASLGPGGGCEAASGHLKVKRGVKNKKGSENKNTKRYSFAFVWIYLEFV